MRRYLCVWCLNWPLDRLRRTRLAMRTGRPTRTSKKPRAPNVPFVLTETGVHGLVVAAANAAARAAGVSVGLGFSDACARASGLQSEEIDRTADAATLKALAVWAMRWTPLVAVDGADGLMLDVTGCAHLFGGEAALLGDVETRLAAGGIEAKIALATTPGAAWALAHGGGTGCILEGAKMEEGLAGLPVAALRLSTGALQILRRFGLTRIGQLYDIDRRALARRFRSKNLSDQVLLRLDQALGRRLEPLIPLRPAPDYSARLPCAEPLGHTEGVQEGLARLLDQLAAELTAHGVGARDFDFSAYRSDGTVSCTSVSASRPVRDAGHIARLFTERLDRIDPGFGIDLLALEARRTESMGAEGRSLSVELTGGGVDDTAVAALADRITARLGEGSVRVLAPRERHTPELSERFRAFDGVRPDWRGQSEAPRGLRPLRLLDRPEPLDVLAEVPEGPPLRFVWRR
ncbi:MAG: DNA polymerase Y family protein, partial [Pseudomonadota bacterium]